MENVLFQVISEFPLGIGISLRRVINWNSVAGNKLVSVISFCCCLRWFCMELHMYQLFLDEL